MLCPYRVSPVTSTILKISINWGLQSKEISKEMKAEGKVRLEELLKGTRSSPQDFQMSLSRLFGRRKLCRLSRHAEAVGHIHQLYLSFSPKGGTDWGHKQCHDERGHFSSLPFISRSEFKIIGRTHQEDSKGIIQIWVKRKPVQVQMMKEEKVEPNRM